MRGKDGAKSEIAALQAGNAPPKDPDSIGSSNYAKLPVAVIFGRGIEAEDVEEIRKACGGSASKLAWVQSDPDMKANTM